MERERKLLQSRHVKEAARDERIIATMTKEQEKQEQRAPAAEKPAKRVRGENRTAGRTRTRPRTRGQDRSLGD